jgi:hypothetical protein
MFIESSEPLTTADDADALVPDGRVLTAVHQRCKHNTRTVRGSSRPLRASTGGPTASTVDSTLLRGRQGATVSSRCTRIPRITPLAPNVRLGLRYLRLVRANCHRMLHGARPVALSGGFTFADREGLSADGCASGFGWGIRRCRRGVEVDGLRGEQPPLWRSHSFLRGAWPRPISWAQSRGA